MKQPNRTAAAPKSSLTKQSVFFGILLLTKTEETGEDQMDYPNLARNQDVCQTGLIFEIGSLYAYFQQVRDTRKAKGRRYPMVVLLLVMLLAKLSGEDTPSGIAD